MSAIRGIFRRGRLWSRSPQWQPPIPVSRLTTRMFRGEGVAADRFPVEGWLCKRRYPFMNSVRGLASSSIEDELDSEMENETPEGKTVEEQYSRMSPLEHVLLRPGMYVGSTQRAPPAPCWVLATPPDPPTEEVRNLDPFSLFGLAPSEVEEEEEEESDVEEDEPDVDPEEQEVLEPQISPFRIVEKEYGVVPALIKVFDEILVNASDNRMRYPKTCKRIDIVIDRGDEDREPFVRILNDGKGIPVHMHETEKMYVPELVFGHLLTGSNFDDSEKRVTGGRHGYGAKLTNIFSKTFTVETLDSRKRLKYRQTWSNNMTVADPPIITKIPRDAGKLSDYTCVEFVPDLQRLTSDSNCSVIPMEDYAVMCRRVIDAAGCAAGKLRVTLNGQDVSFSSFADYCRLYRSSTALPLSFKKLNARWHVCAGLSESGSLEAISFVNGMATARGGTHVNALVNQITKHIHAVVVKRMPDVAELVTIPLIRRNLFLCVDAQIENASFDSQMKEFLTSSPDTFGSSCALPLTFLKSLVREEEQGGPGIVEHLVRSAQGSQQAKLLRSGKKKTRRQLLSIPKLEDAHKAGSDGEQGCTLILTEGDSAKSLAIAGLEVIGRDYFGVFPLRGKLLNVRAVPIAKLAKNEEIKALLAIIGLNFDREYDTLHERRKLRYRRVMIMTDQDTDGSHIKGLVINFFRCFWPKLLQPPTDVAPKPLGNEPPFLASFVTPLLKASRKGKKNTKDTLAFYSTAEYNSWRNEMGPESLQGWSVKYYKGLGTSTPAEAKEYFSAFVNNLRPFRWKSDADGDMLDMVFDKKRASHRKQWILDKYDMEASVVVDPSEENAVSYEDFVNKEMIHFSHADNIRSIPSVVDGLKPSQRKVLYACFKRNLRSEIKVAQLSGYCAEHTAYHHGEVSLHTTIVGMAQDFVGSNNVNLLIPSGQFGTRLTGGSDAASPRYIFTYLSPITRLIFPEVDEVLLTHCEDDGQVIEPFFYCPVIPMLLVNGCKGIGTGWSSSIPSFHPVDVLNYIRAKLDGTELPKIRPFARGFNGTIETLPSDRGYVSVGRAKKLSGKTIEIDELPLNCWTTTYKEFLSELEQNGVISNVYENHTTTKVSFKITVESSHQERIENLESIYSAFKLRKRLLTSNMHAFDANGVIRQYRTPEEVADDYFPVRMNLYEDRKSVMESEMEYLSLLARNKAKFIQTVTANEIDLLRGKKSKQDLTNRLNELGFSTMSNLRTVRNNNEPFRRRKLATTVDVVGIKAGEIDLDNDGLGEYDYLLNMPLSSLTVEKFSGLQEEASLKDKELERTKATTSADLWRQDLDKLDPKLQEFITS